MEYTAQEAWSKILESAKAKLPEHSSRTWLARVQPVALTDASLVLRAPNSFAVEWIESKYRAPLDAAARALFGPGFRLVLECAPSPEGPYAPPPMPVVGLEELDEEAGGGSGREPTPAPAIGTLNPRYTLANLVVATHNELAVAACQAVADAPGRTYNPLFIYGGVGLGKTHLMQAIASEALRKWPGCRVGYVATEQFTNDLIAAIQARQTTQFHIRYRRLDVLLLDDAHFLAGKEGTQEEFFHTFNALYDARKQIVLTSDRVPQEIPGLQERLLSRFQCGLVVDVKPPDFETRVAILRLKASQDGLTIPHEALTFIAEHCRSSVRELEGAIIKLLAYSSLTRREITRELASQVLGGSFPPARDLGPEQIEAAVAKGFGVDVADLRSKRRQRRVTDPRQVAMYLEKVLLDLPYTRIGGRFGGRDHSTVIHAIRRVQQQIAKDPSFARRVEEIQAQLGRRP
jgi:chromosomal replication initiator protein